MSEVKNKYKKEARQEAVKFLKGRKAAAAESEEALEAFMTEQRERKKEFRKSLPELGRTERRAQKAGYKAYKRRKNRSGRIIAWALVAALLLTGVIVSLPITSMTARVLTSQKYRDDSYDAEIVRGKGERLSQEICEEGFVLLKNDDALLPIDKTTRLAVFGDDAFSFVYGGSGSAGADQSDAETLFEAFEEAGIEYDESVVRDYAKLGVKPGKGSGGIGKMLKNYFAPSDALPDWVMPDDETITEARRKTDTALIVLSSQEVEGDEIDIGILQIMGDAMTNRASLVKKVLETFEHVIFIINSGNVMELGFINDYESADAVLWVGAPGSEGCEVIADVLRGKVNPSGRTVDTWPISIEKEPSYRSYGDFSYENLDMHAMEYSEGIYVGYRYYETRYAGDEEVYWDNVLFPFGHGLSYTSFEQTLIDCEARAGTIYATVGVKNVGEAAGKSVVELYYMVPWYGDDSGERPILELGAFGKTRTLEPGQTDTVELSYPISNMAAYSAKQGGFYLESGDYSICIGDNAHTALFSHESVIIRSTMEKVYDEDSSTRTPIKDLFAFAEGDTTYLSRSDWEGTFPKAPKGYKAKMKLVSAIEDYTKASTGYKTEPTYGENYGIELRSLRGLDYDDAKWDKFLDQFTVKQLIRLCANGGWHTEAIKELGIPKTNLLDGPSGLNSMFASLEAASYPMESVVGSTWNQELALELGETVGAEANVYGVNAWYAPAVNIHRSSIGGRNSEYFSEDPYLTGKMAAQMIKGVQSKGVPAVVKHLVCNDVELNARNGIYIWVNQQALRDLYLVPFEMAIKEGGAAGVMSSFTHLGYKWCGASSELLKDLLRDEWGFRGFVTTDAVLGSWMNAELAVKNGNDLMLEMGLQQSESVLSKAYKADPVGTGNAMRECAHNICYVIVNYMAGVL